MSSIPTQSQQQRSFLQATRKPGVPGAQKTQQYLHEKRHHFIRSASIDRIIKFNTYICSQNYFLLPSLIAWLKSSQTLVQSQIEKCIVYIKYLIFISIACQLKLFFALARSGAAKSWRKAYESDTGSACEMLGLILHYGVTNLIRSLQRKVLTLCVYLTVLFIFLQLATCVYVMSKVFVPGGLIFLFVCLYLISHLNFRVLFHYLKTAEHKIANVRSERRPPKTFVLGKKTISNLNLF